VTTRVPRDVSVHLVSRTPGGPRFLMLRRIPERGGFWQGVSGAPLRGETDTEAAVREVREETGFDVDGRLVALGVSYSYARQPEDAGRWEQLYGRGVDAIRVVAFAAEVPDGEEPALDAREHDAFVWCSYEEADAALDWPIEKDALAGRRAALRVACALTRLGTAS
jgi:lipoyl(octanoyl) transferase